jgi:biopolymer transport protein ExbD
MPIRLNIPNPLRGICGPALWSLLLLTAVLFSLQSRFFTTNGVVIDLPHAGDGECVLTCHAVGVRDINHYVFNGQLIDGEELSSELQKLDKVEPDAVLLLHCDRRAPMESLLYIGRLARRAGFSAIQIAIPQAP